MFDARETYECDGATFVACRDNPGACPGDGWQILSKPGRRGDAGETGPRGEKGNKGELAPTIVSWRSTVSTIVPFRRCRTANQERCWTCVRFLNNSRARRADRHIEARIGQLLGPTEKPWTTRRWLEAVEYSMSA